VNRPRQRPVCGRVPVTGTQGGTQVRLKLGRPDLGAYVDMLDVPVANQEQLSVTFAGVSTLLFDDNQSALLFDGFFSRPSLLVVGLRKIAPNSARIDSGLAALGLNSEPERSRLEAVIPVHSHFDHAMDSADVAQRTGAQLLGGTSTANVGRGADLPKDRMHVVEPRVRMTYGAYALTFVESEHCPPDRFPGSITEPVVPPVKAAAYKCGEAWSVLVEHESGRTALVQGGAGYVPDALRNFSAEVVYLGVGQLGLLPESYIEEYWTHVVRAVGARRAVLTHWDDFFRPLDQPLRALPFAADDLDVTIRVLRRLADNDGIALHLPTLWRREDPWSAPSRRT
jgi:L-ascorbate metabolism protein UlaG (beta-lactamase superfamily)